VPAVAACIFVVSSVLDADFNPCPPPTTIDVRVTNVFLQCDLIDNREVSNVEGRDLAKSFGVPFFESSAKSRINVEEAFYELVRSNIMLFFLFAQHCC
jgi:hypothetical protein